MKHVYQKLEIEENILLDKHLSKSAFIISFKIGWDMGVRHDRDATIGVEKQVFVDFIIQL